MDNHCGDCLHFVGKKCAKGQQNVGEKTVRDCGSFVVKEADATNPSYYKETEIECIDAIRVATEDLNGIEGFDVGQVIKYLWRFKKKNGLEDLKKAKWYLDHLIGLEEKEGKNGKV